MKKILYLTDLNYQAKGRTYCEEDIYITGKLRDEFDLVLCHPKNAEGFEGDADLIIFRNTGPVSAYPAAYRNLVKRVRDRHLNTFNEFTGKADMQGKQYLVDLTKMGYPVIPTIDTMKDLDRIPDVDRYVVKPKDGADSIGLEFISREDLMRRDAGVSDDGQTLIQPAVDFTYEVSFYFINDRLEYALYAPDPAKRWKLERYDVSKADAEFARTFIAWNTIRHGIQRVDACRTADGKLLLVELEDLNPYLSILELEEAVRESFLQDFRDAIREML